MRRELALAALLAACSCTPAPWGTRPLLPEERTPVDEAAREWTRSGLPPFGACPLLETLEVAVSGGALLEDACVYRVESCLSIRSPSPFQANRAVIVIASSAPLEEHPALIAHETLHLLRGCAWEHAGRSVEVYRHGVPEEEWPGIDTPMDPWHRDRTLWRRRGVDTVEGRVQALLEDR